MNKFSNNGQNSYFFGLLTEVDGEYSIVASDIVSHTNGIVYRISSIYDDIDSLKKDLHLLDTGLSPIFISKLQSYMDDKRKSVYRIIDFRDIEGNKLEDKNIPEEINNSEIFQEEQPDLSSAEKVTINFDGETDSIEKQFKDGEYIYISLENESDSTVKVVYDGKKYNALAYSSSLRPTIEDLEFMIDQNFYLAYALVLKGKKGSKSFEIKKIF